ncbi:MAG: hypothetical protein V4820_23375 [Pseudomonadota bacterium]|uniref:hypothetical protein n=1 Tax=Phenylobacterium sp. TaxID=1871053 RepID=UPI002727422E|nr:hypothetical protein [Phenylobacterium sp.]MDO9432123.1 hypothetical protein [Phenylobacterium sp.]
MKILMSSLLLISLGACAGSAGGPDPLGGVASYDALKNAREACVAKGGELMRDDQNSGKRMSDFACKRK